MSGRSVIDQIAPPSQTGPSGRESRAAILFERFKKVRSFSEALCATLEPEDYVVQSMPDVSPTKWHLAHTSWFFETFILKV